MSSLQALQRAAAVVASPFVRAGHAYANAASRRPFAVGIITTGVKTSAADMFAQTVMEGREWKDIDWTRHSAFCIFGFAYLGGFQYVFYTKVLTTMTRPITDRMGHIASAPIKTLIDQALHHPFLYFPTFYILKYSLVQGEPTELAMGRYWEELWPNCQALWMIWVPAQLVNFSVVPTYLQIPFCAGVSFVWTVILSMMRGSDTGSKTLPAEDEQAVVTANVADGTAPATGDKSASGVSADSSPQVAEGEDVHAEPTRFQMPEQGAAVLAQKGTDRVSSEAHPVGAAGSGIVPQSEEPAGADHRDAAVLRAPHGAAAAAASVAEPLRGLNGWRVRCLHRREDSRASCRDVGAQHGTLAAGRARFAGASGVGGLWRGWAGLLHLQHPLSSGLD